MSQLSREGDAAYYMGDRIETIRMAEQLYGTLAVMYFCEINAHKYRQRLGKKEGQPIEQELTKIKWYDRAAKHYFELIGTPGEIMGIDEEGITKHKWR